MKFGKVPEIAEAERPWAHTIEVGPPPGEEDRIGSLDCQIDDHGEFGRTFRFYLELEPGDLEKIQAGNPVEFAVITPRMVPVSVQVFE